MGGTGSKDNLVYSVPIGEKPSNGTRTHRSTKSPEELICFPNESLTNL